MRRVSKNTYLGDNGAIITGNTTMVKATTAAIALLILDAAMDSNYQRQHYECDYSSNPRRRHNGSNYPQSRCHNSYYYPTRRNGITINPKLTINNVMVETVIEIKAINNYANQCYNKATNQLNNNGQNQHNNNGLNQRHNSNRVNNNYLGALDSNTKHILDQIYKLGQVLQHTHNVVTNPKDVKKCLKMLLTIKSRLMTSLMLLYQLQYMIGLMTWVKKFASSRNVTSDKKRIIWRFIWLQHLKWLMTLP